MRRREDIRRFWYFDCQCPRCSDPTELGSYMSAVICFACKLGFLVPTDSLQYKSDWKCDSCGNLQSYDLVNEVISTIESQVSNGSCICMKLIFALFVRPIHTFLSVAFLELRSYMLRPFCSEYQSDSEELVSKALSSCGILFKRHLISKSLLGVFKSTKLFLEARAESPKNISLVFW